MSLLGVTEASMKPRAPRDYAARLVLYRAGDMSRSQRENLRDWLVGQADALVDDGTRYAKRFVAKYHTRVKSKATHD